MNQNNAEGAPGSLFEPGSCSCLLSSLAPMETIQPAPATIQPSISTFPCKVLSNLISPCYSFLCISNPIPADLQIAFLA